MLESAFRLPEAYRRARGGLSVYSMAGPLARMASGRHAPSQPSHARPKSLPLARGDQEGTGRDKEQAPSFSRTKNLQ